MRLEPQDKISVNRIKIIGFIVECVKTAPVGYIGAKTQSKGEMRREGSGKDTLGHQGTYLSLLGPSENTAFTKP
jgi:hypothetical protein